MAFTSAVWMHRKWPNSMHREEKLHIKRPFCVHLVAFTSAVWIAPKRPENRQTAWLERPTGALFSPFLGDVSSESPLFHENRHLPVLFGCPECWKEPFS